MKKNDWWPQFTSISEKYHAIPFCKNYSNDFVRIISMIISALFKGVYSCLLGENSEVFECMQLLYIRGFRIYKYFLDERSDDMHVLHGLFQNYLDFCCRVKTNRYPGMKFICQPLPIFCLLTPKIPCIQHEFVWSYASSKIPTIAVSGHVSDVVSALLFTQ